MNIIKNIILLFIVMMFVSIINVDAASVSIKSVRLIDYTVDAIELSEAKPNGLNIDFDLAFENIGDSAKYEVILDNPTSKEYEISTEKTFSGSNYISYSYELKDKTNRIKANSEVILYINIKYENAVPSDSLVNGKYIENNDMGITLLNEDNPNTFNNILFIIIMIFMMIGATLIFKYTKDKSLYIIVLSLLLVPITVFALEKLKLTVSTKITIAERFNLFYSVGEVIKLDQLDSLDYYDGCTPLKIKIDDNTYENYLRCDDLFVKDSKKYEKGDRVDIKAATVSKLFTNTCYYDSNHIFTCPISAIHYDQSDGFNYTCNDASEYLNICTEEDFNNMNFASTEDTYWYNGYGDVDFYYPNSFTMPNHDVYIYRYILVQS